SQHAPHATSGDDTPLAGWLSSGPRNLCVPDDSAPYGRWSARGHGLPACHGTPSRSPSPPQPTAAPSPPAPKLPGFPHRSPTYSDDVLRTCPMILHGVVIRPRPTG